MKNKKNECGIMNGVEKRKRDVLIIIMMMVILILIGSGGKMIIGNSIKKNETSDEQTAEKVQGKVIEDAAFKLKYSKYTPCDCGYDTCRTWETAVEAEEAISNWYGMWYDDRGRSVEITREYIDNRKYGVKQCYMEVGPHGSWTYIDFFYFDSPQEEWTISTEEVGYKTNEGEVTLDYITVMQTGTYVSTQYCEVDKKTRAQLTDQGMYDKQQIYKRAISDFEYYYDGAYTMTEQLYMTVEFQSVDEATFHYDPDMDEYKIRFKVTINENVFDFLGFSKYTCVLRASYTEENGRLEEVSFELD